MSPLRRITDAVKLAHAQLTHPKGSTPLALHGIQRSGTNYAEACLRRMRVRPVNLVIGHERDDPRHKHFRWYDNKSAIPAFLREYFDNDQHAADLATLNATAGYPPDCAHIVMRKDRTAWLASACNWGMRVNWFPPRREAALAALDVMGHDYDTYYAYWSGMAARHPDRVTLLDVERVTADLAALTDALDRFGVRYRRPPGFHGHIKEVPFSPGDRLRKITTKDIRDRLAAR